MPREKFHQSVAADSPMGQVIRTHYDRLIGDVVDSRFGALTLQHIGHMSVRAAWAIPLQDGSRLLVANDSSKSGSTGPIGIGSETAMSIDLTRLDVNLQTPGKWIPFGGISGGLYDLDARTLDLAVSVEDGAPKGFPVSRLFEAADVNDAAGLYQLAKQGIEGSLPIFHSACADFRAETASGYGVISARQVTRRDTDIPTVEHGFSLVYGRGRNDGISLDAIFSGQDGAPVQVGFFSNRNLNADPHWPDRLADPMLRYGNLLLDLCDAQLEAVEVLPLAG